MGLQDVMENPESWTLDSGQCRTQSCQVELRPSRSTFGQENTKVDQELSLPHRGGTTKPPLFPTPKDTLKKDSTNLLNEGEK